MAERLNISIPEDLNARLSLFKDRLNVSKLCQEAISQAVRIEEFKEKGRSNSDMESLVARLKEESLRYSKKFEEKGFECGVKDAYRLSLDNFCEIQYFREADYLGELQNILSEDARYQDMFAYASEETKKILEKIDSYDDNEWGLHAMFKQQPDDFFITGWLNGVTYIWDKVRDKVFEREEASEPPFMNPEAWGLEPSDESGEES